MILQNLAKAVREQNYYAVVLEFLIVIAGVVIGFQITAWNESRQAGVQAEGYLSRIYQDLGQIEASYHESSLLRREMISFGETVLNAERSTGDAQEDWALLLASFYASQSMSQPSLNTTYNELVSSGDIGLISNPEIRDKLAYHYTIGNETVLNYDPQYRESLRSIIPLHLQRYMWRNCYELRDGSQFFVPCDPPEDAEEVEPVLNRILQDVELKSQLRFWISSQDVAILLLQARMRRVTDMRTLIAEDLGLEHPENTL